MAQRKNNSARKKLADGIVITRIFAAPRSLVFAAWTQPEHLKQWSAPHGFTIPASKGELKVGGKWRACMVSPRGEKMWLSGVYREVIPDELLVFTHAWEGDGVGGHETLVTVRFEDHARGTKLTFAQTGFDSPESAAGHKGGWNQCFERLAEHLPEMTAKAVDGFDPERTIVSRRLIAAPRKMLFKAFSDPEQLARWWGPKGFTSTFKVFDFRPGGSWRFTMHGPNGADYENENNFTEVVPSERIVYQHVQPMHGFTMTMTFAESGGRTELTWCMCFDSAAEAGKLKKFIAGANEQNFDRLEAHLLSLNKIRKP